MTTELKSEQIRRRKEWQDWLGQQEGCPGAGGSAVSTQRREWPQQGQEEWSDMKEMGQGLVDPIRAFSLLSSS